MWLAGFDYLIKSTKEMQVIMKDNNDVMQQTIDQETVHMRKTSLTRDRQSS